MLHLLPLRSIGRIALTVTVLGVLAVIVVGPPQQGTTYATAMKIVRWALSFEAALAAFLFYFWHYIPGLTVRWLFPHIDGNWDGNLHFKKKSSSDNVSVESSKNSKPAQLYVYQSLLRIRLVLETDESTSETLVVKPERDPDFSRFRLFYIFENRSRNGLPNNGRSYRGTAVMEVEPGRPSVLTGTYFTDQGSEGTFSFKRRHQTLSKWQAFWTAIFGAKGAALPIVPEPRDKRGLDLDAQTTRRTT